MLGFLLGGGVPASLATMGVSTRSLPRDNRSDATDGGGGGGGVGRAGDAPMADLAGDGCGGRGGAGDGAEAGELGGPFFHSPLVVNECSGVGGREGRA